VVVLSPALTEVMEALEIQGKIVGVSRYSQMSDIPQGVTQVGGGLDPSIETVLRLEPDLVLHSGTRLTPTLERLVSLGVPVAVFSQNTIRDLLEDIQVLARIFGVPERGQAVIQDIQSKRNSLKDRLSRKISRDTPAPKVCVLFNDEMLLSAGGNTYVSEIIELAGGVNAMAELKEPWPQVSPESLVYYNPDIIVFSISRGFNNDAPDVVLERFANDSRWSGLKAVKEGKLFVLDEALLTVPGPKLISAAEALAEMIHPNS